MPELIIKYKNKKTLDLLLDIAKYFDFSIILPAKSKEKKTKVNGVTLIPGDSSIDTSELQGIFSLKNIDAKQLRQKAWKRTK
jgi:hypothetical protein